MPESIKTVPMVRETSDGGPTTADVHPDEVANFEASGWRVAGKEVIQSEAEETTQAEEVKPARHPRKPRSK